jgi:hypothetical protein
VARSLSSGAGLCAHLSSTPDRHLWDGTYGGSRQLGLWWGPGLVEHLCLGPVEPQCVVLAVHHVEVIGQRVGLGREIEGDAVV